MESVEIILGLANSSLELPLPVGETFNVTFTAKDVREVGAQPIAFSFYTDVNFDPTVLKATDIKYNDNPAVLGFYTQAQTGEIDNSAGTINEVGASSSLIAPFPGTSPVVFTVTFEVLRSAPFTITTDAGDELLSQIVLYGADNDQRANTKFGDFGVEGAINRAPVATNDAVTGAEDAGAITGNVLSNDTDLDGDSLSVSLASETTNGTVDLKADGSFEYTPNADFNGTDSFTYTVSDGELTDTATVDITVTPVNDAPIATDDSVGILEGTTVNIDVLTNDTDSDSSTLTVGAVGTAANGTVAVNDNGTLSYTPNAGFSGSDSFTYTVSDGELSDEGTVSVSVSNINEAPVAIVDSVTGDEDTLITGNVLVNDTDADGDDLTATLASNPTNGSVTLSTDGSFEYTPNANFNGSDSFTYTVSDSEFSNAGTVNITVDAVNDVPAATDDSANTLEDTAVTIDVLNNDTDLDGDTLSVSAVSDGSNGSVTINGDGTVEYTPNANFNGSDSFAYTVSDGELTDEGTVTVSVGAVNKSPVATVDSVVGDEDSVIVGDVLSNDLDADGDDLTATLADGPSNGTVMFNADGSFEYTPNANFNGSDSFTYTVSDGEFSDTGTVNITVDAVNDAPSATDDSGSTLEGRPVTVDLLNNDTDIDGNTLSVNAVSDGSNGTVVINGDGTVEYIPDAGFSGNDSFTYTVSDGELTDEGTVTVSVGAVNKSPVAVVDSIVGNEDSVIAGNVLSNDLDADGDNLAATLASKPSNGSVTFNADGSFEYTPDANFNGSDNFTYTVSDGEFSDTGTVNITVDAVNDAPAATDDSANTVEDTAVTIDVLSDDTDIEGDTLSVSAVSDGSNGSVTINGDGTVDYTPNAGFSGNDSFSYTVSDGELTDEGAVTVSVGAVNKSPVATVDSIVGNEDSVVAGNVLINDIDDDGDDLIATLADEPNNGSVTFNADGSFEYTPNADFNGSDSFTYTVSDGELSDTGTVNITVNAVNDTPTATDDSANTLEDTAVTIDVLSDDADIDGDTLSVSAVNDGSNGSVAINGDGTVDYTPNAGFSGNDSFTYTVSDGELTDEGTVTVSVGAVNKSPVATVDSVVGDEDSAITGNVLSNDIDADGDDLTATLADGPSNGSVAFNADGSFEYMPSADFNGSDSFTYTISDGELSDTGTVNITVDAVNDAPSATDDSGSTLEDQPITVSVLNNDTDIDGDALSVSAVSNGSNGTVTINGDGTVEYIPNAGFSGSDSFTYTVSDGELTDEGTVSVSVGAANKSPVATADAVTGDEDTEIIGNVLANDTDADSDSLTAAVATGPANGTVTVGNDGSFVYTPNANFNGSDSFTYTVSDGNLSDTGTVNLTVAPVNDAPEATDDSASGDADAVITDNVLSNDADLDDDSLTAAISSEAANGTVVVNADGSFEYTPNAGFSGDDSFSYIVSDGELSDTGTVSVTVNSVDAVNTPPTAVNDSATGVEDGVVTGNVLSNDIDIDGDELSAALANGPANGTVNINTDGSFEYTPDADFNGSDSFTYTVSDGEEDAVGTVNLTVEAVNDAPVAAGDSASTTVDTAININVLSNDSDIDRDDLSVDTLVAPTNGTTLLGDGGVVVYTPNPGFSGSDSFTYTVSDGNGGTSNSATVDVLVKAVSQGERIIGTNNSERLVGTAGDDRIIGRGGNDTLLGKAGNDQLIGGDGRDRILGGDGNDQLIGGNDNDRLLGNAGEDRLVGGNGNDRLVGGADNDILLGGADDDTLLGGGGGDRLLGGSGEDRLIGGDGSDSLRGGSGNDHLLGGSGDDRLYGQDGDDLISGGKGNDFLSGGQGKDTFVITFGEGTDTIRDFVVGMDSIRLKGVSLGAIEITQNARNSFIMFEGETLAQLRGVTGLNISDLTAS